MKAYPYMHKHPTSGQTTMSDGMDLRDYFAGLAMQVILQSQYGDGIYVGNINNISEQVCANSAYIMADLMMKQREVKHEQP